MTSGKKILIVLAVVLIGFPFSALVGLAIYSHGAATRAGNEAATIQNMKTIAAVEAEYFITRNRTYATIDQLVQEQFLSSKFGAHPAVADGYVLALKLKSPNGYALTADPQDRSTGKRHFYLDSASEQIHVNSDGPAGPNDPIL